MVVGVGPTALHERHPIDMGGESGEDLRHPGPALPMLSEGERALHEAPHGPGEKPGIGVEAGERLTVSLRELRLVVEGVDLARAPVDEQPDHALRLRGKVGESGGVRLRAEARSRFLRQEAVEREEAESRPAAREYRPTGKDDPRRDGGGIVRHDGDYSTWRVSLSPRSTWQKSASAVAAGCSRPSAAYVAVWESRKVTASANSSVVGARPSASA